VQVAETKDRPLRVLFRGEGVATVVDVDGLKEYRSFWAELPRVHQLDLPPAPSVGPMRPAGFPTIEVRRAP